MATPNANPNNYTFGNPLINAVTNPQPAETPAHRNRVRFGERLPWPVQNAGIFVTYMTDQQWEGFQDHIAQAKMILSLVPNGQIIADHIVCELS